MLWRNWGPMLSSCEVAPSDQVLESIPWCHSCRLNLAQSLPAARLTELLASIYVELGAKSRELSNLMVERIIQGQADQPLDDFLKVVQASDPSALSYHYYSGIGGLYPPDVGLSMHLIVGLGNPGLTYRGTRHNIGFLCVDLISKMWSIPVKERRAKAVLGRGVYAGREVVLAKPRTFMNNSGQGVSYLLTRFAAVVDDLLVIYDDMELPLGRLRIRRSGSDGGHKGVESIISTLRTQTFPRMRLGNRISARRTRICRLCSGPVLQARIGDR